MFIAVFGILSISAAFTRDSMALSSTWIPTGRRSVATTVPPTAAAPTSGTTQPSSIATPSPAATTTHPIVRFIEFPPRRQRRRVAIRSDRLRQSRHRTGTVASDRRNGLAGTAARPAAAAGAWCDRRWLPPARAARGCAPRRTPASVRRARRRPARRPESRPVAPRSADHAAAASSRPPARPHHPGSGARCAPRESATSVLRTIAAAPKTCKPAVGSGIVNNATGGGIRLGARPAERCDMDDPDTPDPWARQPLWTASGLDQQQLPRALYVVATPIGNAADVTLRALWVLRNADCIAAEDTRVTAPLLKRYGIRTRLMAFHRHNERGASEQILARLAQGERVALVSDAGTPGVCDPGAVLVRAALSAGHRVIPVPGASSLTAALSAAGLQAQSVRLLGFLPTRVQARRHLLQEAAARSDGFVLFEAPHRIARTAGELAAVLEPARRIVLARELTKMFEAVVQTTAARLPQAVEQQGERGEFVVVVDTRAAQDPDRVTLDDTSRRWLQALAEEMPAARAAAIAAKVTGVAREVVYR